MKMEKKTKKPATRKKIRNGEHLRLEGVIRQQADQLKIKNGQLKIGIEVQKRSEKMITIFSKAMESAADGIFIIDAQKSSFPVIYTNQSFQKMTGYAKEEILGRNYFLFYEADTDRYITDKIKQTIRRGGSFYGEVLNFQKNGK